MCIRDSPNTGKGDRQYDFLLDGGGRRLYVVTATGSIQASGVTSLEHNEHSLWASVTLRKTLHHWK